MERRTYNPCDECPHGIDRRDGSGNDAMCRICEFNAYLKLGTIDHLRDLHQAEQDGRLHITPAFVWHNGDSGLHEVPYKPWMAQWIATGTKFWLTREDAEAAMAGKG